MNYDEFKKEYKLFENWNSWTDEEFRGEANELLWGHRNGVPQLNSRHQVDSIRLSELEGKHADNHGWYGIDQWTGQENEDRVNSPSHYTRGKQEVIETIEEAVQDAPTPGKGLLQGQVLKYMLRVWLKDNPLEDLKKAQWYLNRLIEKMEK